jgi:hypothetical protein
VFHADSLATARMIPLTVEHPQREDGKRPVHPANVRKLAVGWTGENVRRDGNNVVVPIRITADEGIAAIAAGKRQLSFGYACEVERSDGAWEGQPYTHVQRSIRYNHLAIVDQARAGSVASVRLDAADAVQVEDTPAAAAAGTGRSRTVGVQIRLDSGLSYDVPAEVEVAYKAVAAERADLKTRLDASAAQLAEVAKARDTLAGERDAARAEVAKAQKSDNAPAIAAAVKARLSLVDAARRAKLPADVVEKLDDMTDAEIRVAVIQSRHDDFKADGKSAEYVSARFDAVVESLSSDDVGQKVAGSGDGQRSDAASARDKAIAIMRKRSRGQKTE